MRPPSRLSASARRRRRIWLPLTTVGAFFFALTTQFTDPRPTQIVVLLMAVLIVPALVLDRDEDTVLRTKANTP